MSMAQTFDTIVIGAGPAGSSAATLLAEQGLRVLVLEREKFPRYHIGESLLPFTSLSAEAIGAAGQDAAIGVCQKVQRPVRVPVGPGIAAFLFFDPV